MNITPALPNLYQPSPEPDRATVGPVRAPARATDEREPGNRRPSALDAAERDELSARLQATVERHDGATSAKASRALASYGRVAAGSEQPDLRELLGFDAYV